MELKDILQEYRRTHNMSQRAFAIKSGVSFSYISMLERNQRGGTHTTINPSLDVLEKLAKAMNMTTDDLISKIGDNLSVSCNGDMEYLMVVTSIYYELDDEARAQLADYAQYLLWRAKQ